MVVWCRVKVYLIFVSVFCLMVISMLEYAFRAFIIRNVEVIFCYANQLIEASVSYGFHFEFQKRKTNTDHQQSTSFTV